MADIVAIDIDCVISISALLTTLLKGSWQADCAMATPMHGSSIS